MLKNYKVRLKVLSPIHIGMGDAYDPTQFVFDQDGLMYVFDTNDFLKSLDEKKSEEFCKLAMDSRNPVPVFRFFRNNFDKNKVKCRQIKASKDIFTRYEEILSSGSLDKNAINQFELKRNIYNPIKGVPYIPGSSIKGCLKTLWLSEINRLSERPVKRNPEKAPYKEELKNFENLYLNGSFSNDPFRFIKVSDFYPVENDEVFLSRIMYAVMFSKSEKANLKKADKQSSLTVALEVIPTGNIFEGVISFDDQENYPENAKTRKISLKGLIQRAEGYYRGYAKQIDGKKVLVNGKMIKEAVALQKLGAMSFSYSKDMQEKLWKTSIPVRIGHHSSAEFITIDDCRSIKITPPQVREAKYASESTTYWLASSKKKPESPKNLQSFGWALLEFEELD